MRFRQDPLFGPNQWCGSTPNEYQEATKKKTASNPEAAFYSTKLSYLPYTEPLSGADKFKLLLQIKKEFKRRATVPRDQAKPHFL